MKKISFYTKSGVEVDLANFTPEMIKLEDIAHGLSNLCRYNGQTSMYYSVAEHCVLLCQYAHEQGYTPEVQAALLLHDGSEAYVGDVVYHLKRALPYFMEVEEKITSQIYLKYGVEYDRVVDVVSCLDRSICIDEMYQMMRWVDPALFQGDKEYQPLHIKCEGWLPGQAKSEYLAETRRLGLSD